MTEPERAAEFRRLYSAGVAAAQRGEEAPAALDFAKAATMAPDLWCDVATKLAKEGEETAALDHFKTALSVTKLAGIRTGIFNNVATIYAKRGQLAEAEEMLDQALKEDANNADALTNLGQVRKWQRRLDASDRYTDRALAINPWHSEAAFLKALNTLDRGDYVKGFELYEVRWRSKTNGIRKIECFQPEWPGPGAVDWRTGKPFKKLFVYCEQGAGDTFLMVRYAKLIREAGMSQFWALKQGMAGLLGNLVDGWSENGEPPEDFDCHIPSASLPRVFQSSIQTLPQPPYVGVSGGFNYGEGFHIGICWRGNKAQFNDAIRSTNLDHWKPVLQVASERGFTLHSLQVDGADEALLYPQIQTHPVPADWLETARRLIGLDLVLTVDTSILHLSGALGIRTWCALHARPYFVFPVALDFCPWYPKVVLIKQQFAHDWFDVFDQMAGRLKLL